MNKNRSAFALGLSVLLAVVAFGIAAFQYASYDPGREETARQLAASQEDLLVFIDAFLDRRTGSLVAPPEEICRIGGSAVAESDDVYEEELAAIQRTGRLFQTWGSGTTGLRARSASWTRPSRTAWSR